MAIIKCRNCGKRISDSENVCPFCDDNLSNDLFCPACNSKNITLSDVGVDPNKTEKKEMVSRYHFWGGTIGALFGRIRAEEKYPDVKDSQIEYICNDCKHKFRRY